MRAQYGSVEALFLPELVAEYGGQDAADFLHEAASDPQVQRLRVNGLFRIIRECRSSNHVLALVKGSGTSKHLALPTLFFDRPPTMQYPELLAKADELARRKLNAYTTVASLLIQRYNFLPVNHAAEVFIDQKGMPIRHAALVRGTARMRETSHTNGLVEVLPSACQSAIDGIYPFAYFKTKNDRPALNYHDAVTYAVVQQSIDTAQRLASDQRF